MRWSDSYLGVAGLTLTTPFLPRQPCSTKHRFNAPSGLGADANRAVEPRARCNAFNNLNRSVGRRGMGGDWSPRWSSQRTGRLGNVSQSRLSRNQQLENAVGEDAGQP